MQGRMNKDLDERIIPDGEYRDALNIEVSTAEESSVGTARNVAGNELLGSVRLQDRFWKGGYEFTVFEYDSNENLQQVIEPYVYHSPANFADFADIAETVGVVTDPATDKIYSFVSNIIEPYFVPAGTGSNVAATTFAKTSVGATTDSKSIILNNVADLVVGMVLTGTDVVFGSVIESIDASNNTITLNKSNSVADATDLTFSAAALIGYNVDAILQTRSAQTLATVQNSRLVGVFVDVFNVHRVPNQQLTVWAVADGTSPAAKRNKIGFNGQNITTLFIEEPNDPIESSSNMNFANGVYEGAKVELILNGVNILTPDLTNPITNSAIGTVQVSSVKRTVVQDGPLLGSTNPAIIIELNKALPDGLVTDANIAAGLSYKFSNERLLDFKPGVPLKYTETNASGTKVIENHPTPIDTKINCIDIIDGVLYFTDGRTEPKRIDIEKGIKGSNRVLNINAVNNSGAEPNYGIMLFETTKMQYENPISQKFGLNPTNPSYNGGLGIVQQKKRKPYELEDITVIRRHPLNPPTVDLRRSKRVGLTHGIGLESNIGINNATTIQTSIVFTVTKNKAREYAFPSFYTGSVEGSNNLKNHSWRVGDVLVLDSIHAVSPTTSGSESDSGSRRLKVKITAITNGTFAMPTDTSDTTPYHETFGQKIVNIYRDAEHGYFDFTATPVPTYTKYDDILTVTAELIDKNDALSSANLSNVATMNYFEARLEDPEAALFEDKFPRFAIRYKYDDNQFSAISPFTEPCFLPDTNYMWNKDEGQNIAMTNSIRQIVLRDFITPSTPVDVKRIDILIKFDGENNIYQLDSITKGSREWNDDNEKFAKTVLGPNQLVSDNAIPNLNYGLSVIAAGQYENNSYGNTRGVYYVNSEKLGAVIPSNQILRPFDAVPVKARTQCVSANRLIYGNYSLDYDLVTADGDTVIPRLYYSWRDPDDSRRNSFREISYSNKGAYRKYGTPERSIKSDRTYTLGISFLDRFGRQSPVIIGPESAYTAPQSSAYSTSRLRAKLELEGGIPFWATHYRYYIKETTNEYYNLALYRAYPAEGLGTSEANRTTSYWLAFHSADRNKIQEDSVLRLKSRAGEGAAWRYGEETIRVLAISNEAPPDDEIEVAIPSKQKQGKFYVKVRATESLIKGMKGHYGPTLFGGVLGDVFVPAIFEVLPDPDIGLNIFFEIPRTYPINLSDKTIEDFINFGDFVSCVRSGYDDNGTDNSNPTFISIIDDPANPGTDLQLTGLEEDGVTVFNKNTGSKPTELLHLHDSKTEPVFEDLTTRILALRGSNLIGGIQNIQLEAFRNFGAPVLDNNAVTTGGTSNFYIAGTFDDPLLPTTNPLYTGNPNIAGAHANRSSLDSFGTLHVHKLDGTKVSMIINNFNDALPNFGKIGMGYNPNVGGGTAAFENEQSYTRTNTVQVNSSTFVSENTLPFHNCWHFGNGVESDRIRDDFNAPQLDNGVKASSTSDTYGRKNYKHGLIFSGLYNSKTDINNLNQFIKAEGITKDLNPEYGSIQKLFTRNTNILAFCENKVLKILSNKDALFNADGNTNLTSSKAVLGTAVPFSGDYGISRNPESFAEDEFRCYFTDRDRGVVCRLSMDGVTPISDIGMSDYFADELKTAVACVGAFNDKKGEYDLTIHNNLGTDDTDNDTTVDVTKRVQTLSFNEKTNSWVSFKSYIIEQGLSINNEYYTIKKGRVFHHHDDALKGRNNFYGTQYFSSVTPIFNDAPGSIKSFQTINYEGTQAQVIANNRTGTTNGAHNNTTTLTLASIPTGLTVGQNVTGNDFTLPTSLQLTPVTIIAIDTASNQLTLSAPVSIATAKTVVFSDDKYYNDDAYTGWFVESIITDQQEGKVLEFKEKEGKWFNNISGVATTFSNDLGGGGGTGNLDSQEFSVQGIGSLNSIAGAGNSGIFYTSTVQANISTTCTVNPTITNNTESDIPHGTSFGTYTSFDHDTGKQKITICPPDGFSFVNPQTYNTGTQTYGAPNIIIDNFTLTGYLDGATIQNGGPDYTTAVLPDTISLSLVIPTTPQSCIDIIVHWHDSYIPNQNVVLNINIAADAAGNDIQLYDYEIPIEHDLIWEQGASPEWYIDSVTAIDPNVDVSALVVGAGTSNGHFDEVNFGPTLSGNDVSAQLSGMFDYTTTSNTFQVVYQAEEGHFFPMPNTLTNQDIINSFLFPEVVGFPFVGSSSSSGPLNNDFYTPGSGVIGVIGNDFIGKFYTVTWDFTSYNNNGQANELTAIYTFDPISIYMAVEGEIPLETSPNPNGLLGWYQNFGCGVPEPVPFDDGGDPGLVWQPTQDIGGGDEPVIPDGDDTQGGADDIFDEIVPIVEEFTVTVNITHQKADGSAGVGVGTVANPLTTSFTALAGDLLSDFTAQIPMVAQGGFTFAESNITEVDGNADNTPVANVASYEDGVSGDTLTTNIHKITARDLDPGNPGDVVLIDFLFENVAITGDMTITIIIKGDAVKLGDIAKSHRYDVIMTYIKSPADPEVFTIFGDGVSGNHMTTAAPDADYNVSAADISANISTKMRRTKSSILGSSLNGVQQTTSTHTLKTLQGHRFTVQVGATGDEFLETVGAPLVSATSAIGTNNADAADRIKAFLEANIDEYCKVESSNNPELYEFSFGVTVTNIGTANVQEEIVVTIKHTGNDLTHADVISIFYDKGFFAQAVDYNNPNYL